MHLGLHAEPQAGLCEALPSPLLALGLLYMIPSPSFNVWP